MDVLLVGVGIYGGHTEDLFDEDAHITFDRTTTTVNVWNEDNHLVGSDTCIMSTDETKKLALLARVMHCFTVSFDTPCLLEGDKMYDLEHNLLPTDVTNHYSGAPITNLGADLWTCWGTAIDASELKATRFQFSSCKDRRRGRCSLSEGQIPYVFYWPLT